MTHATTKPHDTSGTPRTTGRVLHSSRGYDALAWLFMLGREAAFRKRIIDLARLEQGESVLDVGCGTGTLAILAKTYVGPTGSVHGIDASPEMIARAERKAKKARADVAFENAVVEALPFPDATFDAVFSTLMLHHLPRAARQVAAREMRRVLKSGGRGVVVDFGVAGRGRRGLLGHFHRHGRVELGEIIGVLSDAGFRVRDSGAMGMRDLHFVVAEVP
jgi:ubiquinone/menaquinone biosynthesis C-methylase UbiE